MAEGWLTGWKAITQYTGLDRKTLKKMIENDGLPIRTLSSGTRVALAGEIDAWLVFFTGEKTKPKKGTTFP